MKRPNLSINTLVALLIGYSIGHFQQQLGNGRDLATRSSVTSTTTANQSQPPQETSQRPQTTTTSSTTTASVRDHDPIWDVVPLQRSNGKVVLPGSTAAVGDTFNPFHQYMLKLQTGGGADFPELPMWHTWIHFFEAYHNHFYRFRGNDPIVFMEVGVQSGGKIALLRDYFGPGFNYVGIDINPSTQKFASVDWVHIHIGDSANATFWQSIKAQYPTVDIFLDDGGHQMDQQMMAMKEMLPHVQQDGLYICEDLATSWDTYFGGKPLQDARHAEFIESTMVGMIHKSMDWFQSGWMSGTLRWRERDVPNNHWPTEDPWWRTIAQQVKHIHYYNQLVVYEKGIQFQPNNVLTVGNVIPLEPSGEHPPTDWGVILKKLQTFTNSPWKW